MSKLLLSFLVTALLFLPGCDLLVGVFKAGFWTAIIGIVLIVALIIYGISKML